mmetsp:Transcript_1720/g.2750  ORF Transcript_1720/g.2750 Transcript_1720/m.2750 type:complete len:167 (-) Transcript_1720:455-955(-)
MLWGECLSGALYWNDFLNLSKECGFKDPRLVNHNDIKIANKSLQAMVGDQMKFFSATYRLWKLSSLEPDCEDYGQAVIYKGSKGPCDDVLLSPTSFTLDKGHVFIARKVHPVCGNTYRMLQETRFAPLFEFIGDFQTHYGIFEGCGKSIPFGESGKSSSNSKGKCC